MNKTTKAIAKRRSAERVAMIAIASFMIVFALLAWRLQVGMDPVINAGPKTNVASQPVVQKRLIIKRKVVRVIVDQPAQSNSGTSSTSSGTSSAGGQQTVSSAPAQPVASTPAPAPAPAPAPTTSAS